MPSSNAKTTQFWKRATLGLLAHQADPLPKVINHTFSGSGNLEDPYIVSWVPEDDDNPINFCDTTKWLVNMLGAFSAFTVALASSGYSGGLANIVTHFATTEEIAVLGVSLFVIGFAVGPLLWAPLSEVYGRRYVLVASGAALTVTLAGSAGAQNIQTLLVLRFLAGSLGSASMAVPGGIIADLFPPTSRGLALGLFVVAPFLGPALGPIIGGFMVERGGWRWVQGLLAIIACVQWLAMLFFLPETYPPVLLRRRAQRLSELTGQVYRSAMEVNHIGGSLMVTLSRPWVLLFREPIVLLISLYMSIIYGTLYMFFAAYPIIFQKIRGWSEGLGGLSFIGIMIGILFSIPGMFISHVRYQKKASKEPRRLAPETRLPDCFIATVCIPIGLFWFAWTNSPGIHWIVPIVAGVPFGFLSISMDGRSRMDPKIHPETLGCCLLWSAPSVSIRKMLGALNLADLATIIRKAVSKADKHYTDDVMTLIDSLDDARRLTLTAGLDSAGIHCTQSSWASYPFYSLDWGSKLGHNMTSVRMPGNGPLDGTHIILPLLPNGGLEVLVGVEASLLDKLLNEPLLNKFAVARCL